MLHELYAAWPQFRPFHHDINMAFIGSTVSGGESLKGWAGTQVPALFFCLHAPTAAQTPDKRAFAARSGPSANLCRCESPRAKIGRASCRERVCLSLYISVVALSFQKKT